MSNFRKDPLGLLLTRTKVKGQDLVQVSQQGVILPQRAKRPGTQGTAAAMFISAG